MEYKIIKCGFGNVSYDKLPQSSLKKGTNLFESGHVLNVIENVNPHETFISANIIKQTSINQPPYNVKLYVSTLFYY